MALRRLHLAAEVPAQILAEVVCATFEEAEDVHGRRGPGGSQAKGFRASMWTPQHGDRSTACVMHDGLW
eukprot:1798361-Prorocentrum_lima.AAC.1